MPWSDAVVTGAASGIGRALATALARRGVRLTLADVNGPGLAAVADELGGTAVETDVSRPEDAERLAATAGAVDLACFNAGVLGSHYGPIWETEPADFARVVAVNTGGLLNCLRAFVPRLLATGRPHRVLITASLAGLATWPSDGGYGASKHAAVVLAEQAAFALQGTAVSITVLCPGLVRTGMSDVGADPADVADEALRAAADGRFLVLPREWAAAVRIRGEQLAAGRQPSLPRPDGA